MSTPEPDEKPPVPPGPINGWGQPTSDAPGYAERPAPRYGQYAPPPGSPQAQVPPGAPPGPQYGQPQYAQPQYGQPQYGGGPAANPYGAYPDPAAKPGIVPLRPLTLGEIFDGAFGAIRHNPRVMLGLSAIVITIATAIGAAFGYLISSYIVPALPADFVSAPGVVDFVTAYSATLGVVIVVGIASPIVSGLLIGSIGQSVIGRKTSIGALWSRIGRRAWTLLGFVVLVSLAEFAAFALLVGAVWAAASSSVGLAVTVGLLGVLGLLVAYVWITIRTLLVPPALILEEQKLWVSVGRGWRLSRGSFWRLLGIFLLASLAVNIISSLLTVPFTLIAGLLSGPITGGDGSGAAYFIVTGLGTILTGVLSAAFMAGVNCLLYIDIRMRREGLDVELTAAASDPGQAWDR